MSTKSSKATKLSKLNKPVKIARHTIDILAVYASENETPIPLEVALAKIQSSYSSKHERDKPQVKKCLLEIYSLNNRSFTITIKSYNGKKNLECFSTKCMGTPQVGNLPIDKYKSQSLVFLPILSKDFKSELFVFHPNIISAQEIVIQLVKLIPFKETVYNQSILKLSPSPPKSEVNEMVQTIHSDFDFVDQKIENGNNDALEEGSEYSLSSTFFHNWYTRVENMVSTTPNSLYQSCDYRPSMNGLNEELYLLNQYLKEIRAFMNNLYIIMHDAAKEKALQNGNFRRVVKLPSKTNFVEVIRKIKSSLNISTIHEPVIINPSAKEIINQLLFILRILGDATKSDFTQKPVFVINIKDPIITEITVKYLSDNLNSVNKEFWMELGENYGYLKKTYPLEFDRTMINEFQIRTDLLSPNDEKIKEKNYKSLDNEIERISSKNLELDFSQNYTKNKERSFDKNPQRNNNKIHQKSYLRSYDSENDRESENNFFDQNISLSQPNLLYSIPTRNLPYHDTELTYRSNQPLYDLERQNSGILMHQKYDGRNHIHESSIHSNTSTWKDRQCRFIDAVRLRNGRLMKITQDRSAQNKREISVSCNEVVELLTDYGDVFSAKNALGEVGYCPSSIAQNISSQF